MRMAACPHARVAAQLLPMGAILEALVLYVPVMSSEPKGVTVRGTALDDLREFPDEARRTAGYQIDQVQRGLEPSDWKSMPSIGPGVNEIRIHEGGAFRVIYVAKFADAVHVLHCFQKRT